MIGLMPMGQSLSKMEYLKKESKERSSLTMTVFLKLAGKKVLSAVLIYSACCKKVSSLWLIKNYLLFSGKTFIYLLRIGR